jgi:hypothetical protein
MTGDRELYARGVAGVVASRERIASGAPGASVVRAPRVASAVFPKGPKRAVYNIVSWRAT